MFLMIQTTDQPAHVITVDDIVSLEQSSSDGARPSAVAVREMSQSADRFRSLAFFSQPATSVGQRGQWTVRVTAYDAEGRSSSAWTDESRCPVLFQVIDELNGIQLPSIALNLAQPFAQGFTSPPAGMFMDVAYTLVGRGTPFDRSLVLIRATTSGGQIKSWFEGGLEKLGACLPESQ